MYKIMAVGLILALAIGFYLGKITTKPQIVTKTEVVTKEVEHKKIIVVKEPSGKETTTITDDTTTSTDATSATISKPIILKRLNISGLVGTSFKEFKPVYGLVITKDIIGPISVGVFGFSDRAGISVGVSF